MNMPKLTNDFMVEIIDNIEDWLDKKGVRVPNEERDKELLEHGLDIENVAAFYGEDFDWAMEMIRDVCARHGVIVEDRWEH